MKTHKDGLLEAAHKVDELASDYESDSIRRALIGAAQQLRALAAQEDQRSEAAKGQVERVDINQPGSGSPTEHLQSSDHPTEQSADARLHAFNDALVKSQTPLGPEFQSVLDANRKQLYANDEQSADDLLRECREQINAGLNQFGVPMKDNALVKRIDAHLSRKEV